MSLLLDALKKAAQDKLENKDAAEDLEETASPIAADSERTEIDSNATDLQDQLANDSLGDQQTADSDLTQIESERSITGLDDTAFPQSFSDSGVTETGATELGNSTDFDNTVTKTGRAGGTELELEPIVHDVNEFGLDTIGSDQSLTDFDIEKTKTDLSNTDLDRFLEGNTTTGFHARAEKSKFAFEEDTDDTDTPEKTYSSSLTENIQAQHEDYYSGTPEHAARVFGSKAKTESNTRLYVLMGVAVLSVLIVGGMFAYGYVTELNQTPSIPVSPRAHINDIQASATGNSESDSLTGSEEVDPELLIEQEDYSEILEKTLSEYEDETEVAAEKTDAKVTRESVAAPVRKTTVASQSGQYSISRQQKIKREPLQKILMRAYDAYQQGNYEKAEISYKQALTRSSQNRDALLGMAALSLVKEDKIQAAQYYQTLLNLNPKDDLALSSLAGLQAQHQKKLQSSTEISRLKMILSENPNSPYLYLTLGNIYSSQQRWADAQQAYFDAYRISNDNADYAFNLAVSLEHLGQKQAAIKYYRQALKLAEVGPAHFNSDMVNSRIQALGK